MILIIKDKKKNNNIYFKKMEINNEDKIYIEFDKNIKYLNWLMNIKLN